MEEMNKYKISYMDGEDKKEEVIEANTEREATDSFLDNHPGLMILYVSKVVEDETVTSAIDKPIKEKKIDKKARKEAAQEEIVGMNLKGEKTKKKKENSNKKYTNDISTLILCFKIFLCIVGMTLLIYPIFGLAKLFKGDLYLLIKYERFYKNVTLYYLGFVIAILIVYIVLIVYISWMYYKGERKRTLASRIGSLVAGFVLFTILMLTYATISFSEKTMLLVDYYGFKFTTISLFIFGILSFASEFGIKKSSNKG